MKVPRNRSLEYSDHAGLLYKLAVLYYGRILAAKIIGVGFDDVLGELNLSFVRAAQGYSPESGWTFTAYLGTCCRNNFNKFAKRLMIEQFGTEKVSDFENASFTGRGLGYISTSELMPDADYADYVECENTVGPEERADALLTLRNVMKDETLSRETRAYILSAIGIQLPAQVEGGIRRNTGRIREEVAKRWGVDLGQIRLDRKDGVLPA